MDTNIESLLKDQGVSVEHCLLLDRTLLFNPVSGEYSGIGITGCVLSMSDHDKAEMLALLLDKLTLTL